jgi:polygalacturonase
MVKKMRDGSAKVYLFNVRDFGAKGDGVTEDTKAIQATVDAAPDGSLIYFPPGVYLVGVSTPYGIVVKNRSRLRFVGEGGASVLKVPPERDRRWMTFDDCEDIEVTRLSFDKNGSTRFGGLAFYSSRRIRITQNRFFDSAPKMSDGYDRYAIVFGVGAKVSEDIWVGENIIEHLQVEIDKARRVHIVHNRSLRPEYSAGFGWFSQTQQAICEDWMIAGNLVIDPAIYGICVALDGKRDGSVIRNVVIAENIIVYRQRVGQGRAIMVGTRPEEDMVAKGVVWENIAILNNQIVYEPSLPKPVERPALQVATSSGQERMSKLRISGNLIAGNEKLSAYGMELIGLTDSVINDNAIYGVRSGILMRGGFARNFVHSNRVTDVAGAAFHLAQSGGENVFVSNFVFGRFGVDFQMDGLQPSDRWQK